MIRWIRNIILLAIFSLLLISSVNGLLCGTEVAYNPLKNDLTYKDMIACKFDIITPENEMKLDIIHPAQEVYNFTKADYIVDFAEDRNLEVRGHTLVWHQRIPIWINESWNESELEDILKGHINTTVSHFKNQYPGRVIAWDVVNEALSNCQNGTSFNIMNTTSCQGQEDAFNIWKNVTNYIAKSFNWTHEADPDAKLFYNDYSIEVDEPWGEQRFNATVLLVKDLQNQCVPIHGVGFQMHVAENWMANSYLSKSVLINRFEELQDLGLEIHITELDVKIKISDGTSQSELDRQADVYRTVLEACLAVENCTAFVTWGFTDKYSWINGTYPGYGDALIWDETFQPKPAFYELASVPGSCYTQKWELISVPILENKTLPNALSSFNCSYNSVWEYTSSNNQWISYTPYRPFNSLTKLEPEYGYWIEIDKYGELEFNEIIPDNATFNLIQGWNLMGYPSNITMPVNESTENVSDTIEVIFQYNTSDVGDEWKSYNPERPPFLNTLNYFTPSFGYWFKVESNSSWIFNRTHFKNITSPVGNESSSNPIPNKNAERFGTLIINNKAAENGTLIEAFINNANVANATTINDYYNLIVGPDNTATNQTIEGGKEGDTVVIKVNELEAGSFTWIEGGIAQKNIVMNPSFIIQNDSGSNVAYFDDYGNIVLKGTCTVGTCNAPDNSFIFKDSAGNEVAHVDPDGNLCIGAGDCSDQSNNCNNPTGDSFIVKDELDIIASYIDGNGDLCLIGNLIENGNP